MLWAASVRLSRRSAAPERPQAANDAVSPLFVQSVEKAMKVLSAFDGSNAAGVGDAGAATGVASVCADGAETGASAFAGG